MRLVKNEKFIRLNIKNSKVFISNHQSFIAICCMSLMLIGFMAGRALLSLGMFFFFLNTFSTFKKNEVKNNKYWLWGLVWVAIYALSYFWSFDKGYWLERVQVKYALIIFPFSFLFHKKLKINHLELFTYILTLCSLLGCFYSLYFYIVQFDQVIHNIYYAKVLITPAYKDHIRYSIFIACVVIWLFYYYKNALHDWFKKCIPFLIVFFIIYLHILAVRSGLMVLYLFILLFFLRTLFLKNWKISVALLACSVLVIYLAFQNIASLQAKKKYFLQTLEAYNKNNADVNYSDIGRIVSYKLALKSIKEHPIIGVGAGGVREEMKQQYLKNYPNINAKQMIVPHNQVLEVLLATGVFGTIPFLIWLFYPLTFVKKNRDGFYLFATWLVLFCCLMVEAMLEIQMGLFVYLFPILLMLWVQSSTKENEILNSKTYI